MERIKKINLTKFEDLVIRQKIPPEGRAPLARGSGRSAKIFNLKLKTYPDLPNIYCAILLP